MSSHTLYGFLIILLRNSAAKPGRGIGLLILILLSACAGITPEAKPTITKLTVASRLSLPFTPQKCLWEERTGTLLILEQDSPNVYFYRDGKQLYSIGGFGNEKTNFIKLSDIAIDPDGNLLALDSFARLVRKYTSSGMWIADIELQGFLQPEKLCSTTDGDLIIYDAAPKELSRISGFDSRVIYSFGKFQLSGAGNVFCNKEYVLVTSESSKATQLYSLMGQLIRTYPYQLGMDNFLYSYYYENGSVNLQEGELKLPLGWQSDTVKLMIDKTALLLLHGSELIRFERTLGDR